ncbi:SubName: Full=Uncharacterized protein {ECO:0000313/EMBL:CCA73627.1} [Serendipita indica DSM 11827]|uniref:F-box domain-containing protein n=1 Tax=Serendipita indica (strain DSM 11827) TaxID=1109443 RepID=G4TQN8_SERID|nr:SubName: Full=Uncharacterized protein {ECO:0000313/EMBL:CCA73627.1} [Serendipita indica DSM 11827]CCA73627.1 hypothetical protein PIIN_07580 [Serendipita indica DSM 11827]
MNSIFQGDPVLLRPRAATHPSVHLVLLPLLPTAPQRAPIPSELWGRILRNTISSRSDTKSQDEQSALLKLVLVCKAFKDVVLPLLYTKPYIPSFDKFVQFCDKLIDSDRKWDNLRRIRYSTPGRWVESLDLSHLSHLTGGQHLKFDKLVAQLFPILPFLRRLTLDHTAPLSRGAMHTLADSDAALSLTILRGVHIPSTQRASYLQTESLVQLLRSCVNLEQLELRGEGLDGDGDMHDPDAIYAPANFDLPNLTLLSVVHVPFSPIIQALARAELASLCAMTITLYADYAKTSDASKLLDAHATKLTTLTFSPCEAWPSTTTHTPEDILDMCPRLRYLSLAIIPNSLSRPTVPSPLAILCIPRPTIEFLNRIVEPLMPSLREVRIREVRYLSKAMGMGAAKAGSSAIILEWRRRLSRRGVIVLDAVGRSGP